MPTTPQLYWTETGLDKDKMVKINGDFVEKGGLGSCG